MDLKSTEYQLGVELKHFDQYFLFSLFYNFSLHIMLYVWILIKIFVQLMSGKVSQCFIEEGGIKKASIDIISSS